MVKCLEGFDNGICQLVVVTVLLLLLVVVLLCPDSHKQQQPHINTNKLPDLIIKTFQTLHHSYRSSLLKSTQKTNLCDVPPYKPFKLIKPIHINALLTTSH
jgi:hypothetical protein